jgi:hypothetical protein
MMMKWFVLIKNRRDSFTVKKYKILSECLFLSISQACTNCLFFQNFEWVEHFMIEFSWWFVHLNIFNWESYLFVILIIRHSDFMRVSVRCLMTLTFFHMLLSKISDFFHREDDFSFSKSIDSFFNYVFVEFYLIEAHSRLKFVVSKKRRHLSNCRNKSIRDIFDRRQSVCSIVLLMIDVNSQISLRFLIDNFILFVRFEMKCDEQFRFYSQHSTNRISYQRYKLWIFISNHCNK